MQSLAAYHGRIPFIRDIPKPRLVPGLEGRCDIPGRQQAIFGNQIILGSGHDAGTKDGGSSVAHDVPKTCLPVRTICKSGSHRSGAVAKVPTATLGKLNALIVSESEGGATTGLPAITNESQPSPSSSSSPPSLPIQIVAYPHLHGQPYATFPKYNLGGPLNNSGDLLTTYQEYWETRHQSGTTNGTVRWSEWEQGNQHRQHPGTGTVIKIILMCKNEWPLIRDWIWYHGEIFGFENLYVLDGSTTDNGNYRFTKPFLDQARDQYGVNVIFSPSSLSELMTEIVDLALAIAPSCDFIMKMDPDVYLTFVSDSRECLTSRYHTGRKYGDNAEDCTLTPYHLQEYLQAHDKNLGLISDGRRFSIRYSQRSVQDKFLCATHRTNEIESYKMEPIVDSRRADSRSKTYELLQNMGPHMLKSLHDSRTVETVDLGGHSGSTHSPFSDEEIPEDQSNDNNDVKIGVLHFHARCLETEVANFRKTLLSQGTITEQDSNEDIIHKLTVRGRQRPLNPCGTLGFKKPIPSYHKALFLSKFLKNCTEATQEGFYPDAEVSRELRTNPDFHGFLVATRAKYNSTW
mmetsp:Transcript_40992/g.98158  ORF Transcript_40992/g.98158 Transcript_40992/m.98158 type:complete len:574 (-) Transcript_40992:3299-5020(-)